MKMKMAVRKRYLRFLLPAIALLLLLALLVLWISGFGVRYLLRRPAQLSEVPVCDSEDRETKNAKIEEFATELYRHGGQAVNMITKLFGEETAKRVIVEHMYGVK